MAVALFELVGFILPVIIVVKVLFNIFTQWTF